MKPASNVLLVLAAAAAVLTQGCVNAFCPHFCRCDDAVGMVECPQKSDLDIIPITLNPMIRRLLLSRNRIRTVDASFQFYGQLEFVDFSNNVIERLPDRSFSSQKKLLDLRLSDNLVTNLTELTFIGLKSLQSLSLARNRIQELPKNVFKHLVKLESLDLSGNQMHTVHAEAFLTSPSASSASSPTSHLKILRLSENRLPAVPNALPNTVEQLFLNGNPLTEGLSESSFQSLSLLRTLDLSSCGELGSTPMTSKVLRGPSQSLESLLLHNNSFISVPSELLGVLSHLQTLALGANRIQVLKRDCLRGLGVLTSLDLRNSTDLIKIEGGAFGTNTALEAILLDASPQLKAFHRAAFNVRSSDLRLSFRNMGWTSLRADLLEALAASEALVSVDVRGNELACDCHAKGIKEFLEMRPAVANSSEVLCASPVRLRGLPMLDVETADLICSSGGSSSSSGSGSRASEETKASVSESTRKRGRTTTIKSDSKVISSDYEEDYSTEQMTSGGGGGAIEKQETGEEPLMFHVTSELRLLLIIVCVSSALATGFSIFLLVHCRRRYCLRPVSLVCACAKPGSPGNSSDKGFLLSSALCCRCTSRLEDDAGMHAPDTPLDCLCCEITTSSKARAPLVGSSSHHIVHATPSSSLETAGNAAGPLLGSSTMAKFYHQPNDGGSGNSTLLQAHQHQQQQQQQQQQKRTHTLQQIHSQGPHHTYNYLRRPPQAQSMLPGPSGSSSIAAARMASAVSAASVISSENNYFNTVNTKSSFCGEDDDDDCFFSMTKDRRQVIKPIPVSEL